MSATFPYHIYKPGYSLTPIHAKEGDLRVWWVPQVPMRIRFYWPVQNPFEAKMVLELLAQYDLYQHATGIKPDYANCGGLEVLEDDGDGQLDWFEWCHPETGDDIDEWHQEAVRQVEIDHG